MNDRLCQRTMQDSIPEVSGDKLWMKERTEEAPAIIPLFPWVRGFPAFLFASRCNKAYVIRPTKGGNVLAGIWIFVGWGFQKQCAHRTFFPIGRSVSSLLSTDPVSGGRRVASSPSSSVALKLHNTRRQKEGRDRLRATKIPTVQFFRSIEEKRRKTIIPPAPQRAPRRLS